MENERTISSEEQELLKPLASEQDEITPRSHLSKALTKRAKRNIILVITGGILLIIIGILIGPSLLVRFSLLLEGNKEAVTSQEEQTIYIAPPLIDTLPSATNSAQIKLTGVAEGAKKVKIYRNGRLIGTPTIKSNGTFSTPITLLEGKNEIKAKALLNATNESTFSEVLTITYTNKAPELLLSSPSDGQSFEKDASPIRIEGTSTNASRITINGFQAIVQSDGSFSYDLPLKGGDNEITVIAYDDAGNKSEKKITVHYSE